MHCREGAVNANIVESTLEIHIKILKIHVRWSGNFLLGIYLEESILNYRKSYVKTISRLSFVIADIIENSLTI